jgi:uncharacterized protein involved in oxidation of intracellular sulfur
MKLALVIYSDDPETVWNAFRLGIFALKAGDSVEVFLLAKGVECESIGNDKFDVDAQIEEFVGLKGSILACGSCLKIRNSEGSQNCPLSTMKDLYDIINESDKVLTF